MQIMCVRACVRTCACVRARAPAYTKEVGWGWGEERESCLHEQHSYTTLSKVWTVQTPEQPNVFST